MRLLKKMLAVLSFVLVAFIVGCSNNSNINVTGSMEITIFKTSITIDTTFVDCEDGLLASNKVKVNVKVYDNEEAEISKKNITVNSETLVGTAVDVTSLEADTEYTVKLIASLDGNQKVLETKTIKTINNGASLEDPIKIYTKSQFEAMNREPDAYYSLEADLDFEGEELSAIFNSSNKFTGYLEGNGHTISNFKLDADTTYSGVFGYIKGATITNLNLNNAVFNANRGERYIGALVGYAVNSTITNVHADVVSITYKGQTTKTFMIGGLVGWAEKSTVENCSVKNLTFAIDEAKLKGYIGGLVGQNTSSVVENSFVEGNIKAVVSYTSNSNGLAYIGGLIGLNDSAKGVNTCYAKTNITVTELNDYSGKTTHKTFVGGLIGGNATTVCKFNDCAAIGDITVTLEKSNTVYVGGLVGRFIQGSTASNSVYVPAENGITIKLMDENGSVVENVIQQKAYVGLVCGYSDAQSKLENVFAYENKFSYTPSVAENNQITVNEGAVSTDLTNLSDVIKNLIG